MMYSEFTALAKRPITEDDYHKIVEPVYNYHPACTDKPTTAKLYDLGGLQLFRDMTETAGASARLRFGSFPLLLSSFPASIGSGSASAGSLNRSATAPATTTTRSASTTDPAPTTAPRWGGSSTI